MNWLDDLTDKQFWGAMAVGVIVGVLLLMLREHYK